MTTRQINPDSLLTLATILAANGHIPRHSVGGWESAGDGHSARGPLGVTGSLGQIVKHGGRHYVCDQASGDTDPRCHLPNNHPDYRPCARAHWTRIPLPAECDWDYIPTQYHRPVAECRIAG